MLVKAVRYFHYYRYIQKKLLKLFDRAKAQKKSMAKSSQGTL